MIGDGCIIGMGTLIAPKQDIPDNTVIYGPQNISRVVPNAVEVVTTTLCFYLND